MHKGRQGELPRSLTQEGGFLAVALDEMDFRARPLGQRAGDHQAGKAPARSEIDPNQRLRSKRQELERIENVAAPDPIEGGGRNEVGGLLPFQQQFQKAVEAGCRFT